jgi:hypothetical protein
MVAEQLDEFVHSLLDQLAVERPPVDAVGIARGLGIVVAVDSRMAGRARRVRLAVGPAETRPAIYVRPEPRAERRQWAVAHELGEHFAADLFEVTGLHESEATAEDRERMANVFAEALLLPRDEFLAEGTACDWDLAALKERFATASHELIARRMVAFVPGLHVTVIDNGLLHARYAAFGRRAPLERAEREVLRHCGQSGLPQERCLEHVRLRAWPIHEPDHRREILITQWTDADF